MRGYIIGSGWKDYQKTGAICGIALPAGLREAEQLPQPIFTPSTKAAIGTHDENIPFAEVEKLIGAERAREVRDATLRLYTEAADVRARQGASSSPTPSSSSAPTPPGKLVLIDEALTPDSSRFWPADQYRVGMSPPSFDKQYVRDWLESQKWNKQPPAPELPADVLAQHRREVPSRRCACSPAGRSPSSADARRMEQTSPAPVPPQPEVAPAPPPPPAPVNIVAADEAGIARAVELLRAGEVVAVPDRDGVRARRGRRERRRGREDLRAEGSAGRLIR